MPRAKPRIGPMDGKRYQQEVEGGDSSPRFEDHPRQGMTSGHDGGEATVYELLWSREGGRERRRLLKGLGR